MGPDLGYSLFATVQNTDRSVSHLKRVIYFDYQQQQFSGRGSTSGTAVWFQSLSESHPRLAIGSSYLDPSLELRIDLRINITTGLCVSV